MVLRGGGEEEEDHRPLSVWETGAGVSFPTGGQAGPPGAIPRLKTRDNAGEKHAHERLTHLGELEKDPGSSGQQLSGARGEDTGSRVSPAQPGPGPPWGSGLPWGPGEAALGGGLPGERGAQGLAPVASRPCCSSRKTLETSVWGGVRNGPDRPPHAPPGNHSGAKVRLAWRGRSCPQPRGP